MREASVWYESNCDGPLFYRNDLGLETRAKTLIEVGFVKEGRSIGTKDGWLEPEHPYVLYRYSTEKGFSKEIRFGHYIECFSTPEEAMEAGDRILKEEGYTLKLGIQKKKMHSYVRTAKDESELNDAMQEIVESLSNS